MFSLFLILKMFLALQTTCKDICLHPYDCNILTHKYLINFIVRAYDYPPTLVTY